MWSRYACTKYQQRARYGSNGNLRVEKILFLDERHYQIAILRRNDGDEAAPYI
jgi:hypothetical protein